MPLNPLAYWRQILMAIAALAVFYWIANLDPFHSKQRLQNRAETAEQQAVINEAGTQALDTYHRETIVIQSKSERAAENVQQAPGADAPLPPAVRDAWAGGLRDLRAKPDDQPPA